MARAYKIYLEPEDIESREVYLVDHDDDASEITADDTDALDWILCDNEGYYVYEVKPVSVEEATKYLLKL